MQTINLLENKEVLAKFEQNETLNLYMAQIIEELCIKLSGHAKLDMYVFCDGILGAEVSAFDCTLGFDDIQLCVRIAQRWVKAFEKAGTKYAPVSCYINNKGVLTLTLYAE